MEVSQKVKNEVALGPSDSTSGYISKEIQNTNLKQYMPPMFTAALFTTAKIWKQPNYQ